MSVLLFFFVLWYTCIAFFMSLFYSLYKFLLGLQQSGHRHCWVDLMVYTHTPVIQPNINLRFLISHRIISMEYVCFCLCLCLWDEHIHFHFISFHARYSVVCFFFTEVSVFLFRCFDRCRYFLQAEAWKARLQGVYLPHMLFTFACTHTHKTYAYILLHRRKIQYFMGEIGFLCAYASIFISMPSLFISFTFDSLSLLHFSFIHSFKWHSGSHAYMFTLNAYIHVCTSACVFMQLAKSNDSSNN